MSANRTFAFVAAAAALLAALAGEPRPPAEAHDHIRAVELARWIREQRRVHVLDLRSEAEFAELAIPTATHATLTDLTSLALPRSDTVVVYAASGAAAARAVQALRVGSFEHVYVLSGGMYGWLADVLNPTLPEHATAAEEAAFAQLAALSRYFGGVPRRGEPVAASPARAASGDSAQPAQDALRRIRRRGC